MEPTSGHALSLAFVMDPLESIQIDADTTFVLMLEAQRRGHAIWHIDPNDLGAEGGRPHAWCRPVQVRREVGNHADVGPEVLTDLESAFDVVFQRKDPPVDAAYVRARIGDLAKNADLSKFIL